MSTAPIDDLDRRLDAAWREFYGSPVGGTPSSIELAYKPLRELLRTAARSDS